MAVNLHSGKVTNWLAITKMAGPLRGVMILMYRCYVLSSCSILLYKFGVYINIGFIKDNDNCKKQYIIIHVTNKLKHAKIVEIGSMCSIICNHILLLQSDFQFNKYILSL